MLLGTQNAPTQQWSIYHRRGRDSIILSICGTGKPMSENGSSDYRKHTERHTCNTAT